jgi:DNA-binding winged helix-turn-helix (wHTH) protein
MNDRRADVRLIFGFSGANGMQSAVQIPRGYLDFGRFALDLDSRIMIDPSGGTVELRRREFDLLLTFGRNPGRALSRTTLLLAIAGREAEAFDRAIDVYVGRLRRRIENDPKQPRLIVTVPGVGYRLAVKPISTPPQCQADADRRPDEPANREWFSILAAYNKANAERNAKAISALYAEDATMIRRSDGLLSGRAMIEGMYAQHFEHYSPHPSKLEHVAAIGNDLMLRAGSWSGTYQGQDGPIHLAGSWTTTDVRDGDTWKIHSETTFIYSPADSIDSRSARSRWPDACATGGCRLWLPFMAKAAGANTRRPL